MKNDYDYKKDDFFKSKGFYIALYSCIGMIVILGVFVSVNNILGGKKAKPGGSATLPNETAAVSQDLVTPYQDANTSQINPPVSSYVDPDENPTLLDGILSDLEKQEQLAQTEAMDKDDIKETATITLSQPVKEEAVQKEEPEEISAIDTTFESFVDGNKMNWPLIGDIVMDYSVDHVVYDKTLDLYRTNDALWISGEVGSQVKATADGIVKSVVTGTEYGNSIVVDNGNGWATTYAQLQDNILVKEGDVVRMGQVIGGVANPSKSAVVEESHLNLKVSKDNATIDPKLLLAQ